MACEAWRPKLDAYVDGELAAADAGALSAHMRNCAACASEVLDRVRMKRSVALAGQRYEPSAQLRERVMASVSMKPRRAGWAWRILLAPALLVVILSVAVSFYGSRENATRERVYSELADLHVAALASSTPVDVISSDRHTVKPWFQGKLPFTFSLPELLGSDFTLVGGRVTYLEQAPGAHLIYQIRKHEISVFIFQEREAGAANLPSGAAHALSFNEETWTHDGLRYFVVGDTNAADIRALSDLLRSAK